MSPTFGLSFGRYITPSLRWEVAVDYTPDTNLTSDGMMKYATFGEPGTAIENQEYGVFRKDTTKLSRTTALFSLLYDFNTGTRFTPYVGAGGGFTWRRLKRSSSEVASCSDTFDFPGISCGGGLPSTVSSSGSSSINQIDLAASVQAGIATNITDQILWDNGWQMLWEGGAISASTPSVSGENRVTYKDSVVQQFRSGIRIKFD
jgi:opacity protein-like surface antigen